MLRLAVLALGGIAALVVLERKRPLRRRAPARQPRRIRRNLALGALSLGVAGLIERPLAMWLARPVEARRLGLAQRLPTRAARDFAAIMALDYTIYVWHVLTHRVPFLWRFHLVHHIDRELSASTALRFHAGEMLLSVPYRLAQVRLLGVSPRALDRWQRFFFASVLLHHSNLRLPERLERLLARVFTTPRMHGIHHSQHRAERDSNWSSGLSVWDHLHGTFRLDVPQDAVPIGVGGFEEAEKRSVAASLRLPFTRASRFTPTGVF